MLLLTLLLWGVACPWTCCSPLGGLFTQQQAYFMSLWWVLRAAGGWPQEEHARFLSLLRPVKGDYSHLVLLAEEELPAFTRAQVRSSGYWHCIQQGLMD
jgi:hypothetical protein